MKIAQKILIYFIVYLNAQNKFIFFKVILKSILVSTILLWCINKDPYIFDKKEKPFQLDLLHSI